MQLHLNRFPESYAIDFVDGRGCTLARGAHEVPPQRHGWHETEVLGKRFAEEGSALRPGSFSTFTHDQPKASAHRLRIPQQCPLLHPDAAPPSISVPQRPLRITRA